MTKDYVRHILANLAVWGVVIAYPYATLYLLITGYRRWRAGHDAFDRLLFGGLMLAVAVLFLFAFWYWLLPDTAGIQ